MKEISFDQPQNATPANSYQDMSSNNAVENSIDFMHYYRLMLRNAWKIILFSLVVGGFSVFYALSLAPVYFAKTTLLIENQQPNVLSFQDVYQVDTRGQTYLKTQLQILKSRALASKVVDSMNLTKHPAFDLRQTPKKKNTLSFDKVLHFFSPPVDSEIEATDDSSLSSAELLIEESNAEGLISEEIEERVRARAVAILMNSIQVYPIHGTKLVTIHFSAPSSDLAADIANQYAQTFIESHLEAKLEVTQQATSWLSERLGELGQTLRESEQALQNFREREQLVDTGDAGSIDLAELEQLTQTLVVATTEKNDAQTLYLKIANGNFALDILLAIPVIANNPVVQSLVSSSAEANRKVAELSKRYGDKHPQMLSATSDATQVRRELTSQVNNITQGLRVTFLAAEESEAALRGQIADVKHRLQNLGRKQFLLRELEREVEANRQVYEVFLNRGKETSESANLQAVNARVIDAALPPQYPGKPEKKKIVMIALLLSCFFAAGVVLLLDFLDNTIKIPEDVEDRLGVPLLGHLPLDKSNKDKSPFLGFLSDEKWHFAEAVRTVRTSFILSCLDKPAKVIVVTSTVPNEGKSTVSLCLSHALGQMEKVLLIDGDMRKPSIGKALDISLLTSGLSNLIAGTAEVDECITRLPKSEVDVLTAGVVLGNPLDLIASDRFAVVLTMLKNRYDRIIIDSAPVQAVSDSLVIATHADALVYVIKSDGAATPLIKKGLSRLNQTTARFSGVVLNQVDIEKVKKQSGYGADYYENYGYAYGDTQDT